MGNRTDMGKSSITHFTVKPKVSLIKNLNKEEVASGGDNRDQRLTSIILYIICILLLVHFIHKPLDFKLFAC